MGRKKKENKTVDTKPLVISYSSKVRIDRVNSKGKIVKSQTTHNNATDKLFKFLLTCLKGAYQESLRPVYSIPLKETTVAGNKHYVLMMTRESDVTRYVVSSNNISYNDTTGVLTYKIMIPNNIIRNLEFNGLSFYPSDSLNSLVDGTDIIDVKPSMYFLFEEPVIETSDLNLVITWQIKLQDDGLTV